MKPVQILTAMLIVAAASFAVGDADAATIVVSYERGHPDVLINGYRTEAMGTFRLDDGGTQRLALCIEAHESHSTRQGAYAKTANRVESAELDALLWLTERGPALDDDRALAAASLAWFYAEARRSIGPLVWSDGNRGFAPIGPLSPEPWDALAPFSLRHMIGLRTGYSDLDRVEVATAALHRQVSAMRGPWTISATGQRFRLTGPGGPITGRPVRVAVRPIGGAEREEVHFTDDDGWVTPGIGRPVDGASVTAAADSPGVHAEWDGNAAIQRMSTATNRTITARFDVAPFPRHVHVQKVSTDPTIGVAGGEFEVFDATGTPIDTATSDAAGIARFDPIDPAAHPGPYDVREIVAPPGLGRTAPDARLADLSTDPQRPTTVEMVDAPLTAPVTIRKRLSEPDLGPTDRSGFVFTIERHADEWADEAITAGSGVTDAIELPLGVYDVCEQSVPEWAAGLIDGGCVTLTVDLGAVTGATTIEVDYVNVVPAPSIDTVATDVTDGDHELFTTGGQVVDAVELSGLVPGTTYTVRGLVVDAASGAPINATVQSTVVADAPSMRVELLFEIPPLPPGDVVVVEQLLVAGRIVAEHRDLGDPDQTLSIVSPPTPKTTTTKTTTTPATSTTIAVISTTTTVPVAATTTTTSVPVAPRIAPPTLPRTGGDAAATILRIGDLGFVLGVGLIALVSFLPRRCERLTSSG